MHKMVFGIFSDVTRANDALADLPRKGIEQQNTSVIVQDAVVRQQLTTQPATPAQRAATGTATGAVTGAALGGIAGLLVGIGTIAIPGLGALLVAGPIATALGLTGAVAATASGAVSGAIAGGLVGALVNLGLPEEKARMYEERIKAGNIVLAVSADSEKERRIAENVLEAHGASEINYYTLTNGEEAYFPRHFA
ncbi:DUF1269 domain-containing protein [Candidatus Roizmanbacteria bacterium]|nr:DUF1269 domain-containing protein [Candidatus Roizmanbacteria bacterium]